jgi:hypothetical protein
VTNYSGAQGRLFGAAGYRVDQLGGYLAGF